MYFEDRLFEIKRSLDSATQLLAAFQAENNYVSLDKQVESSIESLSGIEGEKMAIDLQVTRMRSEFSSENRRLADLENRENVLQARIQDYMGSGGTLLPALRKLPERASRYGELLRGAKTRETLYEYVLHCREEARFEEANDMPEVRVLEYAQVPVKKTQPNRTIIFLMFLFGGFIITSSGILAARWWDIQRRLRTSIFVKACNASLLLSRAGRRFMPDLPGGKTQ
jgi:uncharacterized protein involved in exopolysaccharide biosynthesis